jgi:hypothetical protein
MARPCSEEAYGAIADDVFDALRVDLRAGGGSVAIGSSRRSANRQKPPKCQGRIVA